MYLGLFCVILLFAFKATFNLYSTSFVLVVYALWYFDGKEYTGERRWDWFRSWSIWRRFSPIQYTYADNVTDLKNGTPRRVYLVEPAHTWIPMVWGIGLHGGRIEFARAHPLHFVVPPCFMWIPIMRDVLLWMGAVTYSIKNDDLSMKEVILSLLNAGRSVCICPQLSQFELDDELLQFFIENRIDVVPVVICGEQERYQIRTWPAFQAFFARHLHYPFPTCFWIRFNTRKRPPLLEQQFCGIKHSSAYANVQLLRESIQETINKLSV